MCYCEAIENYVRQCISKGIVINWRVKTEECRKLYRVDSRSPDGQKYVYLIIL